MFSAFLWSLLVRPDLMDRIDGYRIYGVLANVVIGVGWMLLGASLVAARGRTEESTAPALVSPSA